ncbi:hypothetical protein EV193_103632 [Herbihabitans rhizosphaerae]|uniref:Thiaminase-2/PQQC domain-containing protein n=1 Tax=Herbihabitans rhizosphaerae TaxID=1872711 RepID=A0A4Q7KY73_9PSEU|nr:transcriptional regulator [Herbihabitans rhizosphaerae]RZS41310.1 hypothetical protein EV193_103632 [Herbihabitans rhizosphaerae]
MGSDTSDARELLRSIRAELAPAESDNRLVPLIESGAADRAVFAAIAAEETHIVRSDWRSCLQLATRAGEPTARAWFSGVAQGESLALGKLPALALAAGMTEQELDDYEPRAGCQAYPSYFAWLALNGEPCDVVIGVVANFSAWGDYCSRIAIAMRERYEFDAEACAFFDFFAVPVPDVEDQAVAAVQAGIDTGRLDERRARRYGRLFQSYELMFWNTLADT